GFGSGREIHATASGASPTASPREPPCAPIPPLGALSFLQPPTGGGCGAAARGARDARRGCGSRAERPAQRPRGLASELRSSTRRAAALDGEGTPAAITSATDEEGQPLPHQGGRRRAG